jgi:hypothetical protein
MNGFVRTLGTLTLPIYPSFTVNLAIALALHLNCWTAQLHTCGHSRLHIVVLSFDYELLTELRERLPNR